MEEKGLSAEVARWSSDSDCYRLNLEEAIQGAFLDPELF